LHLAAARGALELVKRLLAAGADSKIKDHLGLTPASLAARYQRLDVVLFLSGIK